MKKGIVIIGLLGLALGVSAAQAQEAPMAGMKMGRPASHAASMTEVMGAPGLVPFDIMTGQAGQWMVGYQFMFEKLDGILEGTDAVGEANVLNRFQTTPTDMTNQMHMVMAMYAPTDELTVMAMLPYVRSRFSFPEGASQRPAFARPGRCASCAIPGWSAAEPPPPEGRWVRLPD